MVDDMEEQATSRDASDVVICGSMASRGKCGRLIRDCDFVLGGDGDLWGMIWKICVLVLHDCAF
jgi:hypothetical protein